MDRDTFEIIGKIETAQARIENIRYLFSLGFDDGGMMDVIEHLLAECDDELDKATEMLRPEAQ